MIIIADSSPIIALSRIGKLDILKNLYGKIFIPRAVEKEILLEHSNKINLAKITWIKTKSLSQHLSVDILSIDLGLGESETLGLALELKADLIILDEIAARAMAESLRIKYTGVLGALLKAKEKKLIVSVKELLDSLCQNEFRISRQLYHDILELAKEK